jgi:dTDP-4-dehydrorhamnose 3,5-epimerase
VKIIETKLPGVVIIEPRVHDDERGFFLETFHLARYARDIGISLPFVQDNHSRSRRGVLRGLHAQRHRPQGKLVRAARGEVFDVVVDINRVSATFGHWISATLSDSNHRQVWIPPGYAHGFLVLSEDADFEYKCTDYYDQTDEIGVIWNDPDVAINWPLEAPIVSTKDSALPLLRRLWSEA